MKSFMGLFMRPIAYPFAVLAFALVMNSALPRAARADDALPKSVPPASEKLDRKARMEEMGKDNPEAAKLVAMAQDLYNSLPKAEAARLVTVRTGFGMIRAAELAKDEIGKSVAVCGKENPPLKKDLDAKFQAFQGAVMPEAERQEKNLQVALSRPNFTRPEPVRAFLDQLNKTTLYARAQQDKDMVRVTTPEACRELGESMDKNSGVIVGALRKITWPDAAAASAPAKSAPAKSE